ncbi:MAG: hypothetical protein OXC92_01175 [Flavobacteriaceae bacterium]|nr:hypothetical protein [Flavobacteriaceae bacterium]MCY4215582.1 hypothetical protein [Flavobacteriaceae bacterium]MCY4253199.1 hypothetical protein [Flavobacteriaceae bacterium]
MFAFIRRLVEEFNISGSREKTKNTQDIDNSGNKNIFSGRDTHYHNHFYKSDKNEEDKKSFYEMNNLEISKEIFGHTYYTIYGGFNVAEREVEYKIVLLSMNKVDLEFYKEKRHSIPPF